MSVPVIAIVGRPNVGKSTLFNCLTKSRQALVANEPGVTRDRQLAEGIFNGKSYIVIDTAGIVDKPLDAIEQAAQEQSQLAILEASLIFLVVDARQDLMPLERQLADKLRKAEKKVFLVINKVDGLNPELAATEYYQLGFEWQFPIAATQNMGIHSLMTKASTFFSHNAFESNEIINKTIPVVAMVGRPNVGKSTLVNRMLGEERVIVCDHPGTTRDSIYVSMQRMTKEYTLIDTAGVRKRKNVTERVEKFSIVKTLQAVKDANVVLLIFDAREGLTDQDLSLIDFTLEAGRGLIICANKWDGMSAEDKAQIKTQLTYRLKFAHFAPIHFISALHGTGVGELFPIIDKVFKCALKQFTTTQLTDLLNLAITTHQPPLVSGRRIKLRYAHCGGHNPLTIVIHGNQTNELPLSYRRFLVNFYIKALQLKGTPIRMIFKAGENPYKDKPNLLTPRQVKKRQRLMKHVKQAKRKG